MLYHTETLARIWGAKVKLPSTLATVGDRGMAAPSEKSPLIKGYQHNPRPIKKVQLRPQLRRTSSY